MPRTARVDAHRAGLDSPASARHCSAAKKAAARFGDFFAEPPVLDQLVTAG